MRREEGWRGVGVARTKIGERKKDERGKVLVYNS
jgi:hypothetical protein